MLESTAYPLRPIDQKCPLLLAQKFCRMRASSRVTVTPASGHRHGVLGRVIVKGSPVRVTVTGYSVGSSSGGLRFASPSRGTRSGHRQGVSGSRHRHWAPGRVTVRGSPVRVTVTGHPAGSPSGGLRFQVRHNAIRLASDTSSFHLIDRPFCDASRACFSSWMVGCAGLASYPGAPASYLGLAAGHAEPTSRTCGVSHPGW